MIAFFAASVSSNAFEHFHSLKTNLTPLITNEAMIKSDSASIISFAAFLVAYLTFFMPFFFLSFPGAFWYRPPRRAAFIVLFAVRQSFAELRGFLFCKLVLAH